MTTPGTGIAGAASYSPAQKPRQAPALELCEALDGKTYLWPVATLRRLVAAWERGDQAALETEILKAKGRMGI